jgi:hypothetical protein
VATTSNNHEVVVIAAAARAIGSAQQGEGLLR